MNGDDKGVRRISYTVHRQFNGKRRFEHWLVDNQVYFVTARCRDRFPAFDSALARNVFWDRFEYHTRHFGYIPWVTSLMSNHYHTIGYLGQGNNLPELIRRLHGSVAKLVNDLLPERHVPFWTQKSRGHGDYFDGCIRNERQASLAYAYVLNQSIKHRICNDWRRYPDTHVGLEVDASVRTAIECGAFLPGVPYPRYFKR
jgi:hypothetical protein